MEPVQYMARIQAIRGCDEQGATHLEGILTLSVGLRSMILLETDAGVGVRAEFKTRMHHKRKREHMRVFYWHE